ncbi:hypothetical protein VTN31DRAFT_1817 [Thermomyces dupontii]|uniref:uncharacterized protein n=1 Tax=Talaromyces thermophilus TaxID=28565 RepID=UPI003743D55F
MASNQPTFTSADRIRQLNEIDKDVAKLVHSAGLAIQALTNAKIETADGGSDPVEVRKAAFKQATAQYFALLSSIDVRLRRQVYALEEAGIVAPENAPAPGAGGGSGGGAVGTSFRSDVSSGAAATTSAGGGAGGAGSSSFNPLEISWLNTRKDTVERDKEAELWAAAGEFAARVSGGDSEMEGMK